MLQKKKKKVPVMFGNLQSIHKGKLQVLIKHFKYIL